MSYICTFVIISTVTYTLTPEDYASFAMVIMNQNHRGMEITVNIGEYKSHNHMKNH